MRPSPKHHYVEWGFIGLIAVLCTALTALQYRWTGEVARAEMTRHAATLRDQAQLLGHAFDAEFSESCNALSPTPAELTQLGRDAAHLARYRKWLESEPRPIFSRIGVAVPAGDGAELFLLDAKAEKMIPAEWPRSWHFVRDGLSRRRPGGPGGGGPPPNADRSTLVHDFRIPDGPPQRGKPPEMERLIVELDLAYVQSTWLPALFQRYLNPNGEALVDMEVKLGGPPGTMIYTSQAPGYTTSGTRDTDATVRFYHYERVGENIGPRDNGRWVLRAWSRPGSLEALVAASRQRNLAAAVLLNLLILVAGFLLVRYTRRSRQLSETQMNFVASVSHELRTPLTVLRAAAHNLEHGVVHEPDRVARYATLIKQHSEQLTDIVGQVLEFAAAQKKGPTGEHRSLALEDVLQAAIATATPEAQAAHCEIDVRLAPSLPAISGDPAALRRAFQNLIVNAAKHGGEGGWIGVSARTTNGSSPPTIEVEVADLGPGIPEAELAEIFTPFFRGTAAREKQTRGSGLGLSLVREIVEAHGGQLSARSLAGHGAVFTIRLPVSS